MTGGRCGVVGVTDTGRETIGLLDGLAEGRAGDDRMYSNSSLNNDDNVITSRYSC